MRPNVLLITADDMNYNSTGVTGCTIDNITPNIDKLAGEGIRFVHSHVTISVCQPSRSVLMTGRYPHCNGALGFDPINTDVPTLQEQLQKAGYLNGIIGKTSHLTPHSKMCWDFFVRTFNKENGWGREPEVYYKHARSFFEKAAESDKPFFLMANSHDPHRPFAGSQQEVEIFGCNTEYSKQYAPEEVEVPGFLPDLRSIRKEIAEYYTSVHRCDETVGQILKALEDTGLSENTIVIFLSDNGMAFPFAKTNCYLNSTRSPWIFRWPGRINPASVDSTNLISGIDFMPTILEALELPEVEEMNGRSFLKLLQGQEWEPNEDVLTVFNLTSSKKAFPMRCIQTKRFGYIYNSWSDGNNRFQNESMTGLTYNAMKEGAVGDENIKDRLKLFDYRVKEEFYDFENDPDGLNNLIDEPEYQQDINVLRKRLRERMEQSKDPLMNTYLKTIMEM